MSIIKESRHSINGHKKSGIRNLLKLFLKKIRYVKIERGLLEDQIVALEPN